MRTPRLLTAGVAGLLGTAALVGATTSAATADDTPTATYTCASPLGTVTSQLQVTLPDSFTSTPLQAGDTVPQTDGVTGAMILSKELLAQLSTIGHMSGVFAGDAPVGDATTGGPVGAPLDLSFPDTQLAANNDDGSQTIPMTGDLGSFNPSGTGTEGVGFPTKAVFTVNVGAAIDVPCTLNSESASTTLGSVEFTGTDTKSVHFDAALEGKAIAVTAQTGWADGATPGTGAVKATGKVKVAKTTVKKTKKGKKKVTKYVAKPITVTKQLKDGAAKLPVKLPKGTKKGNYKFTVTWNGVKSVVTVKAK